MFFCFQKSGTFFTQGRTSPFTLWNRHRGREFHNITFRDGKGLNLGSLLQPGTEGKCVSLVVLFGHILSWYSLPCRWAYHGAGTHSPICKRHVQTGYFPSFFKYKNSKYTRCLSGEMFALRQCFAIMQREILGQNEKLTSTAKNSADLYFVSLFSLLAWHTQQMYHITIRTTHKRGISAFCLASSSLYRPPFALKENIIRHQSLCDQSNKTKRMSLVAEYFAPPTQCQGNVLKCEDGSCVSYDSLCLLHDNCLPSKCACHSGGREIRDTHYCLNICSPNDCVCPQHHFQCSCGGCRKMALVCDGDIDCRDASDELCGLKYIGRKNNEIDDTGLETLIHDKYFCLAFLCFSGECILIQHVNDLLADCSSGQAEDEPLFKQLREGKIYIECHELNAIPCVPGLPNCFPLDNLCHYDYDIYGNTLWCRDGSHLGDCAAINCTNSYKCPESYCIQVHRVCDGHSDCIHGEDEERCDEHVCEGLLRCSGTLICIHPVHICDRVSHCPNDDDEKGCNLGVCPSRCDCLTHSIICILKSTNVFPMMHMESVKHISIIKSHMPFPDFGGICNLQKLLILNLSRNGIKTICDALKMNCKFHRKLILDLSYNDIYGLRYFCFKSLISLKILSLAFNPLYKFDSYSLSQFSVTYISIRGTQINTLNRNLVTHVNTLEIFDIRDTNLRDIDNDAVAILSGITYLVVNDRRLCCIWNGITNCRSFKNLPSSCSTLLPHPSIGYLAISSGSLLTVINITAYFANRLLTRIVQLTKLVSLMTCVDIMLTTYLLFIGAADMYYNRLFELYIREWRRWIFCQFMEVLTAAATVISLGVSCVVIGLTNKGVISIAFDANEKWRDIIIGLFLSFSIVIITQISFVLVRRFQNVSVTSPVHVCNIMGISRALHWTDALSISVLCVFMLVSFLFISYSAFGVYRHIIRTGKGVKNLSDSLSDNKQNMMSVYNYITVLVIIKALVTLPYPLLRITSLIYNLPEDIYLYATLAYIIAESLSNPILFVVRPLLIARRR